MSHWQGLFEGISSQRKGIHISLLLQGDVTALMIAVYDGHSHIVEVLIRFKPDVNLPTKVGVVTYCSVCSSCVSYAVTCYTTPFQWSGGLDHLNASSLASSLPLTKGHCIPDPLLGLWDDVCWPDWIYPTILQERTHATPHKH